MYLSDAFGCKCQGRRCSCRVKWQISSIKENVLFAWKRNRFGFMVDCAMYREVIQNIFMQDAYLKCNSYAACIFGGRTQSKVTSQRIITPLFSRTKYQKCIYLIQFSESPSQSVLQRKRSHDSQPIGGVRARPFSKQFIFGNTILKNKRYDAGLYSETAIFLHDEGSSFRLNSDAWMC